jgi:hypothetical protein
MVIPRHVLALACAIASTSVCSAQSVVINGQFSVSQSGAAQYSIPIKVPSGIGGLVPNLALSYNSQSKGDGLMGLGWSLSGLSKIVPCPATIAQDGQAKPITYSTADRYCLDGERLIAVTGAYGASGTEYRTERDTFAKIISYGTPGWFQVQTKDGKTLQFGNTADSQIAAAKGSSGIPENYTRRGWALNKVTDSAGNYYNIVYSNVSWSNAGQQNAKDDGVFYPVRIDYGIAYLNAPPLQSITFEYTARDTSPYRIFQGGYPSYSDRFLTKVTTTAVGGITYPGYYLNYDWDRSAQNDEVRIVSISEPGALSTNFTWTPAVLSSAFESYASPVVFSGAGKDYRHYFVDLDGNGKKYWIQIRKAVDEAWIASAGANGAFVAKSWTKVSPAVGKADDYENYFADVNGDGKADWIRVGKASGEAWVALGLGSGQFDFWTKHFLSVGSVNDYAHYFADMDGDGRLDWIRVAKNTDNFSVALATGGGDFEFWTATSTTGIMANSPVNYFGVTTGTAKSSFVRTSCGANGLTVGTWSLSGGLTSQVLSNLSCSDGLTTQNFADTNGDGLSDIVQTHWVTNTMDSGPVASLQPSYSKGNGSFTDSSAEKITTRILLNSRLPDSYFVDFTGEGIASWISVDDSPDGTGSAVATVTRLTPGTLSGVGNIYDAPATQVLNVGKRGQVDRYFADLNGDGKEDWIEVDRTTNSANVRLATAVPVRAITSITNGLGVTHTINYKSLNDTSVHTPETTAVYPLRDITGPRIDEFTRRQNRLQKSWLMVSSVTNADGLETSYTYEGLKADMSGRGLLGVHKTHAVQSDSAISNHVEFRQDWPFTGLTAGTKTTSGISTPQTLEETSNTYDCNDFVSASGCAVTVGRRYFTYLSSSQKSQWDLDGSPLADTTFSAQYDSFGNVVQSTATSTDGFSTTTSNTFNNDTKLWRIGQLLKQSVTKVSP